MRPCHKQPLLSPEAGDRGTEKGKGHLLGLLILFLDRKRIMDKRALAEFLRIDAGPRRHAENHFGQLSRRQGGVGK